MNSFGGSSTDDKRFLSIAMLIESAINNTFPEFNHLKEYNSKARSLVYNLKRNEVNKCSHLIIDSSFK